MPIARQKIMPCLWFDTEAEAAANHYVSIFKNSKIGNISRYGKEGKEIHGKEAGSVMTVEFEIDGQKFVGAQRRPAVQVQRGDLVPDHVRDARPRSTTSGASSPRAARKASAAG